MIKIVVIPPSQPHAGIMLLKLLAMSYIIQQTIETIDHAYSVVAFKTLQ